MKVVTEINNLRNKCESVKLSNLINIQKLNKQMINTMHESNGCGLAAPQIGMNLNMFVAHIHNKDIVFINPSIVEHSQETNFDVEGCLSIPNKAGLVERYNWIKVRYFNGTKFIMEALEGMNARIFQHEYDHLLGILYIDKAIKIAEKAS
jgi:peptide deformylase